MKIIIDLQACQVHGDQHPLSRFTLDLAQALIRQAPQLDVQLLLNGLLPQHIERLRQTFKDLVPAHGASRLQRRRPGGSTKSR